METKESVHFASSQASRSATMAMMNVPLDAYTVEDADQLITPALLVYPDLVDANIETTLGILGNDEGRWRPHIKTAKLGSVLHRLVHYRVTKFKVATTLELLVACEQGATDVLLAFAASGAKARRVAEIASRFQNVHVSVLVERVEDARFWRDTGIGCFIDINPGMDRTGIGAERVDEIEHIARAADVQFRGLHYYDGHLGGYPLHEREKPAHAGYDRLMTVVDALEASGIRVGEVITSGTPAFPFALTYLRFQEKRFLHTVSPGTVVYNDSTSLMLLPPEYGYVPAVLVLASVVSQPTSGIITCDAGHKSVSADAGVPTCTVLGHPDWTPMKPSEEHLPIAVKSDEEIPAGSAVYLLPRHVCPTVNNFDQAVVIKDGRICGVDTVTARGHENPLVLQKPVGAQAPASALPVLD